MFSGKYKKELERFRVRHRGLGRGLAPSLSWEHGIILSSLTFIKYDTRRGANQILSLYTVRSVSLPARGLA